MRVSKTLKMAIVAANLISAAFIGRPPHPAERFGNRAQIQGYDGSRDMASSTSGHPSKPYIISRQDNNNGNNGNNNKPAQDDSCECKKKCQNKHYYIDPQNCSRCLRCEGSLVSDPKSGYKRCVPDNGQHDEDNKKRREKKEKKWPAMKRRMVSKFKEREPERKKRQQQRKIKRLSLCVPIAPLGIDLPFAEDVAGEFFDEEYLSSGDILEHWPRDLLIDEWELEAFDDAGEESFYNGAYLDPWVRHVQSSVAYVTLSMRSLEENSMHRNADTDIGTDLDTNRDTHLRDKRFINGLISLIKGVANSVARGAKAAIPSRPPPTMTFAKPGAGTAARATRVQQSAKVKEMLDKGPLRWCLEKRNPYNHA